MVQQLLEKQGVVGVVAHKILREPRVTIEWLLAKQSSLSDLPAFIGLDGSLIKLESENRKQFFHISFKLFLNKFFLYLIIYNFSDVYGTRIHLLSMWRRSKTARATRRWWRSFARYRQLPAIGYEISSKFELQIIKDVLYE